MTTRWLLPLGMLWVFGICGWNIVENENILADGRTVRLELAPVDPRSLMQGDYMALNYALQNQLRSQAAREDGYVIVKPDRQGIARYVRTQPEREPQGANEVAIRYRVRGRTVKLATNAFFFQEGHEPVFRNAKYGEFRVGENGEPRLVALLDAKLAKLGDNRF